MPLNLQLQMASVRYRYRYSALLAMRSSRIDQQEPERLTDPLALQQPRANVREKERKKSKCSPRHLFLFFFYFNILCHF